MNRAVFQKKKGCLFCSTLVLCRIHFNTDSYSTEKGEKMQRFLEAISFLPPFEQLLQGVPRKIACQAAEIRIRSGRPIVVFTSTENYICGMRRASTEEISRCIYNFGEYSLYSHEKELSEGYFTLRGGHRASFTGTAVNKNGKRESIREFSSICLRIAREHNGIALPLYRLTAELTDMRGLLIVGPPLSAKTTVLRDYCRLLAADKKVAVIDERGEIAAVHNGIPENDVGLNSDILTGFTKVDGIEHAVRLLSPDYIICDEIGMDYREVFACSGRGIVPILSAHCRCIGDVFRNEATLGLIRSQTVNYVALMSGSPEIGRLKGVWKIENENTACVNDSDNLLFHRNNNISKKEIPRQSAYAAFVNA